MSDLEDNLMAETSSSSEDEAMFPSEIDEATSSRYGHLAPLDNQASGLSPPQSQELHDAMDIAEGSGLDMNGADQLMDAAQGANQSNGVGWEPKSEFAKSAELGQEPGSCWKGKKAREEWQKAWNQIEDKNFSLKEFGDPFDESEKK